MRAQQRSRPPIRRYAGVAVAAFLALSGLLVLAFFLASVGREQADQWSSTLAFLLTYGVTSISLLVWFYRRIAAKSVDVGDLARRLRGAIRKLWLVELAAREVEMPKPLQITWKPIHGLKSTRVSRKAGSLVDEADPQRPPAAALVQSFHDLDERLMVIVGEPGAGKTTIASLYVLAATEDDPVGDFDVPVLLSVAAWDPSIRIDDWIVQRVSEDYRRIVGRNSDAVRTLLDDGRLLPILDGVDEIAPENFDAAMREFDRAARRRLSMILTCRSAEYFAAVSRSGALMHAAVFELQAIPLAEALFYLEQGEVAGSATDSKWTPVFNDIAHHPRGVLGMALRTPLMIHLAQTAYAPRDMDPAELLLVPAGEVRAKLIPRYLEAVYPDSSKRPVALRNLSFIAHHLSRVVKDPHYRWWQLALSVPTTVLIIGYALVVLTVTYIVRLLEAVSIGEENQIRFSYESGTAVSVLLPVAVPALMAGVLIGSRSGRFIRSNHGGRRTIKFLSGVLGDLGMAIAVVCFAGGAFGVLLWVLGILSPEVAVTLISYASSPSLSGLSSVGEILLGAFLLLIGSVISNAVAVTQRRGPRQTEAVLRNLTPSLVRGAWIALIVSGVVTAIVAVADDISDLDLGAVGLACAIFAVPVALARLMRMPVDSVGSTSPRRELASDRKSLTAAVSLVLVAYLLIATLIISISLRQEKDYFTPNESQALFVNAASGVPDVVIFTLVCAGSLWLTYSIARIWLALQGRVPWRLTGFLDDAHRGGLLRQVGSSYQIRHQIVGEYLAQRWKNNASVKAKIGHHISWTRRSLFVGAAFLCLGVLIASIDLVGRWVSPDPIGEFLAVESSSEESFIEQLLIQPQGGVMATVTDFSDSSPPAVVNWSLSARTRSLRKYSARRPASVDVVFNENGYSLALTVDSRLDLYDLSGKMVEIGNRGEYVAVYSDAKFFMAIKEDGVVVVWPDGEFKQAKSLTAKGDVLGVAASSDGTVAVRSPDSIVVYDGQSSETYVLPVEAVQRTSVEVPGSPAVGDESYPDVGLELSADGNFLFYSVLDGPVSMFRRTAGGSFAERLGTAASARGFVASVDGRVAAFIDRDGNVAFADTENNKRTAKLFVPGCGEGPGPLAIGGDLLAVGCGRRVKIWSISEVLKAQKTKSSR